MEIQNKRISDGEFARLRQEVLTQWPTGKEVNLEEAGAYHKNLSASRNFSQKLLDAKAQGKTLVQPRAGVPVGRFDPWAKKIPWRREWQPTPVFLPGQPHGQRNLARYSP